MNDKISSLKKIIPSEQADLVHTCRCCGQEKNDWRGVGIAFQEYQPTAKKTRTVKIIHICPACFDEFKKIHQKEALLVGTSPAELSGQTPIMEVLHSEESFAEWRKNQDFIKPPR